MPLAALTALQALRDEAGLAAGARVLVNGASGGVGTFAVQVSRAMGARVTGAASGRNADLVRGLGADESWTTPARASPQERPATTLYSTRSTFSRSGRPAGC